MRQDLQISPHAGPSPQQGALRPLDYATDHRIRRLRVSHVVVSLVLALCIGGSWMLGRSARAQAQTLLYINQAARHIEQDGTVVFENDPAAVRRLIEAGTHHRLQAAGESAVINEPEALQVFHDAHDAEAFDVIGALVFLHELTTPSGMRRIVVVHYLPQYIDGQFNPQAGLIAHIFEPGGYFSRPRLIGESRSKLLVSADLPDAAVDAAGDGAAERQDAAGQDLQFMPPVLRQALDPARHGPRVRWYAGQPDLDDLTHFTIGFEFDGREGMIDGFLTDDARHVRMQTRPDEPRVEASPGGLQVGFQLNLPGALPMSRP